LLYNPSGLVGYWNFEEGSGSTTLDQSGNSDMGTWVGSAGGANNTHYASGKVGNYAGYFDGTTNYISSTVSSYTTPNDVSYAFWDLPRASSGDAAVINYGSELCESNTAQLHCWDNIASESKTYNRTNSGSWEYVVVTISFNTNQVQFFLNGLLVQTNTITVAKGGASYSNIYLGSYNGGSRLFSGDIDDLRLYGRILSAAEVKALYDTQK
jgi:hypothetical protein